MAKVSLTVGAKIKPPLWTTMLPLAFKPVCWPPPVDEDTEAPKLP